MSLKDTDPLLQAAGSLPMERPVCSRGKEARWRPVGMRGEQRAPGHLQSPVSVPEAPELPDSSAVPSVLRPNLASSNESHLLKPRVGFYPFLNKGS